MGWKQSHSLSLLVISSSALALWAFTFQYVRYYVPILPLILCLGVDVFFRRSRYRWVSSFVRVCLLVLVAAQVAVTPAQFWNIPERFPIFRTLGFEKDSAFLARALGGYESSIFLNSVLQPDERILGVEMEGVRFYLNGPLDSLAEALAPSPLHFISQRQPDEVLARTLDINGYKYLFVSAHSLQEAAPWYPFLNPDFLREYARLIHVDVGSRVFRICPKRCGERAGVPQNAR